MSNKRFFAKLSGDIANMEAWIRFEAIDMEAAQSFADDQAEEHYGSYGEPFDEDGDPMFYATVSIYDSEKHDSFFDELKGGDWEVVI